MYAHFFARKAGIGYHIPNHSNNNFLLSKVGVTVVSLARTAPSMVSGFSVVVSVL